MAAPISVGSVRVPGSNSTRNINFASTYVCWFCLSRRPSNFICMQLHARLHKSFRSRKFSIQLYTLHSCRFLFFSFLDGLIRYLADFGWRFCKRRKHTHVDLALAILALALIGSCRAASRWICPFIACDETNHNGDSDGITDVDYGNCSRGDPAPERCVRFAAPHAEFPPRNWRLWYWRPWPVPPSSPRPTAADDARHRPVGLHHHGL